MRSTRALSSKAAKVQKHLVDNVLKNNNCGMNRKFSTNVKLYAPPAHYVSINPATGELMAQFQCQSDKELNEKINKSVAAFKEWNGEFPKHISSTKELTDYINERVDFRTEILMNPLIEVLQQNKEKYAKMMSLEMGKPISQAYAEIDKCCSLIDYYKKNSKQFLAPKVVVENDKIIQQVVNQPLGPILQCAPFNFPFWQVIRFCISSMYVGNSVLIRHNHQVPQTALLIEEAFVKALQKSKASDVLIEGLYQNLFITNEQVSNTISDSRIRGVAFTGSTQVGRIIGEQSGRNLKKHILELGGSDAFIILKDADIDQAIKDAIISRHNNNGQTCISAKRFIVESSIKKQVEERLAEAIKSLKMGDPLDSKNDLGPMARKDLRDKLVDQIKLSLDQGATLLVGGNVPSDEKLKNGFFVEPTLITNVKEDNYAFQNELFGPVTSIIEARDEEHAIELANQSCYGLGGSVYTKDIAKGHSLALRLDVGLSFVNGFVKSAPELPFGGTKDSGYGRECGQEGISEWSNIKTVVIQK
ncbi:hypothetical protein ABK040_011699 [Willaertia magna]